MDLRASDADRARVVEALQRHHGDGRLDDDELEERVAAAWAARHESELHALTADLPSAAPPAPTRDPRPLPRWPGRLEFAVSWREPARVPEAMAELMHLVAPRLAASGYGLTHRGPRSAVFTRRRIPLWVPVVAVLFFPFGLLALLARTEDRITIDLEPDGAGTLLAAYGTAPLPVRRAFALLAD